ncbi:MAG: single-stranded DNA-binding protein [Oscillospiraceae bacterium]|jgi:single-strand DNA-binding protein
MLNRVILMGRITQELELKSTPSNVSVLTFNIAVDRSFVKQGEERQADFITCVAWRQQAEFINKYFGKGRMIALEGNLRSRTYEDKNGSKHYVTEVYVDSVSFTGEAKQGSSGGYASRPTNDSAPKTNNYNEPSNAPINIGNFDDFEEILSEDGVPF